MQAFSLAQHGPLPKQPSCSIAGLPLQAFLLCCNSTSRVAANSTLNFGLVDQTLQAAWKQSFSLIGDYCDVFYFYLLFDWNSQIIWTAVSCSPVLQCWKVLVKPKIIKQDRILYSLKSRYIIRKFFGFEITDILFSPAAVVMKWRTGHEEKYVNRTSHLVPS